MERPHMPAKEVTARLQAELDPEMYTALLKREELAGDTEASTGDEIEDLRRDFLATREFWNAEKPELHVVVDHQVAGPFGEVPTRLYYPSEPGLLPVLVFCHGGGWVLGDLESHDRMCRLLSLESGCAVCAIDYRRAPEHRFPVPIMEARAVTTWLVNEGSAFGIDATRMAMGGDSAGAQIAVGAAMDLRDAGDTPLRQLILIYGVYDDVETESRQLFGNGDYGLTTAAMEFFENAYGTDPEIAKDPRRYPAKAPGLSGLPPTFLAAAGCDILRDDSVAFAQRLADSGVEAELKIYEGVLHGFFHMTRMVQKSRQGVADCAARLRRALF